MPIAATPTRPLAAQVRGEGTPVVCLHSSTGSAAQWAVLAEALSPRWRVVAPELHGHGRSPAWPDKAPDKLDVDAAAVWRLDGEQALHLVGHWMTAHVDPLMARRFVAAELRAA